MEPYDALLYHVLDKVVPHINMLDRSWDTGFSERRIPLWLSQRIMVVSSTCPNSSLKSFLNQTASQQAILAAMYLASAMLKATDFCFLLIQEIEAEPRVKQHPNVLLQSTTLPAQSASVYPWSLILIFFGSIGCALSHKFCGEA